MSESLRDRARVVCVICHQRKVRCDLQDSRDGTCKNCRRAGQQCIRRDGSRKVRKQSMRHERSVPPTPPSLIDGTARPMADIISPAQSSVVLALREGSEWTDSGPQNGEDTGYIAEHSVLLSPEAVPATHISIQLQKTSSATRDTILRVTEADILPKQPLRQALIEAFFDHLYHLYPVIEREDVSGPEASVLLIQAVCMAGSLMKHGYAWTGLSLTHSLYEKVKILIHFRHEPDSLNVLKAMCLLSTWSPNPSDSLSLDSPWHWSGAATRLAFQMGLHSHLSYSRKRDADCRQRIWWLLFASDKLMSACFGRPATIRLSDFDTPLPVLNDLPAHDTKSSVFIHTTRLCIIIGSIADHSTQKEVVSAEEMTTLVQSLCSWLRDLPDDFRLFDASGSRNPYQEPIVELHIAYFATVILLQALQVHGGKISLASTLSIVASSCIVRLYDEIYCREHIRFLLPIHSFYCMVAAVPQIYYRPQSNEGTRLRQDELDIICSVVKQLQTRFGGATTVARNISRLRSELERFKNRNSLQNGISKQTESAVWTVCAMDEYVLELFPFPASLSPNMGLLTERTNIANQETDSVPQPTIDKQFGWFFDETQPFLDIFSLNTCPEIFHNDDGVDATTPLRM